MRTIEDGKGQKPEWKASRNDWRWVEYIYPKFTIIDLNYDLNPQQEGDLKREVEEQGGEIDVLVHPYYLDTVITERYEYQASPEYIQKRDAFIKSAITTKRPLVVFQDDHDELIAKTRNIQSGLLYEVPGADPGNLDFLAANRIGDILERAGITHVIVGGRILMYAYPKDLTGVDELERLCIGKPRALEWASREMILYGCPMRAACGFLQRGFDVSFSPICSPAVPEYSSK